MRLLVVEDEPSIADALARTLRRNGYAVDVAANGHEALDSAAACDYDAVLLDHVWDSEADPFTNTVRVHIMKLRRKINDGFDGPTYIQTVVGRGYRL